MENSYEANRQKVLDLIKEANEYTRSDFFKCVIIVKDAFGLYERHVAWFDCRSDAERWITELSCSDERPFYGRYDGCPIWNKVDELLRCADEI